MTVLFVVCLFVVVVALNTHEHRLGAIAQLWIYAFLLSGRARVTAYVVGLSCYAWERARRG